MNISSRIIARLHALSEAAMVLNSTLDLSEILHKNLSYILETLEVDRGTLYLMDEERKEIWSRVLTGDGLKEIRLPYGVGIAGHVAQTGIPVVLDDAYTDPRFNPSNDLKSGYRTKTMMVLPVRNQQQKQIGVLQLINKHNGTFSESDQEFADSLAGMSAVAIENSRLYEESIKSESLRKELSIARDIQLALIPKSLPQIPGYELHFEYEACSEVGGDYLHVFPLSETRFLIIIADVSGHGIPSSLLVSSLHFAMESRLEDITGLDEMAIKLNNLIFRNSTSAMYITFFAGILDLASDKLICVNAGHPAPLLVRDNTWTNTLSASGAPLGMMKGMGYETAELELTTGDLLVLFTDGITENFNASDDMYGPENLGDLVAHHASKPLEGIVSEVFTDLNAFTANAPADDDRAILVLRKL